MRNKNLFICLFICSLVVSACSKEVPVETEPPKPEYLDITEASFTTYGDLITLVIDSNEAIQSLTDSELVILPNRGEFTTVSVEYIQGNSLNDFMEGYYNGLPNTTSELVDGKFTTDSKAYGFLITEKNNYLLFKAPLEMKDYLSELMGRFQK